VHISDFDVKNLRALDLYETQINNISDFDVKNLHTLNLYYTPISDKDKNKLRKIVKEVY